MQERPTEEMIRGMYVSNELFFSGLGLKEWIEFASGDSESVL